MENNNEKINEELEVKNEEPKEEAAQENPSPKASDSNKKMLPWIIVAASLALAFAIGLAVFLMLPKDSGPKYADYTVTVTDALGLPMSDIVVKFVDENGETKTRVTDDSGIAVMKNTLVGKFTVKIEAGASQAIIPIGEYVLDNGTTTLRAFAHSVDKFQHLAGDVAEDTYATNVGVGTYNVPVTAGEMVYFVFYSTSSGVYKVSIPEDCSATVGYYGIPMFVQSTHRGEGEYNGKSFDFVHRDSATPYVIGINSETSTDIALVIERIGDPPFDPTYDVSVVEVQAKAGLTQCTVPAGTIRDFDVTDRNLTVELRNDGYYYTSTGKLVYLRIASVGSYSYIDVPIASIEDMLAFGVPPGQLGGLGGGNFGGYVFDGEGNYVEKRIYNDMLEKYWEKCDSTYGVYPLNEQLAEAIKVHGDNAGWWDKDNAGTYLFSADIFDENAWLFLCCTFE